MLNQVAKLEILGKLKQLMAALKSQTRLSWVMQLLTRGRLIQTLS